VKEKGGGYRMEELLKQFMNEMREFRSDVNEQFKDIKIDVSGLKKDVSALKEDVSGLKEDVSTLKQGQQRIEEAVNRLESNQPHDITAMLKSIDRKLDDKDFELMVLNNRVFRTEADIERLNKR
jgi:archaellum component FlaC